MNRCLSTLKMIDVSKISVEKCVLHGKNSFALKYLKIELDTKSEIILLNH